MGKSAPPPFENDRVLTPEQCCELLGCSRRYLMRELRAKGKIPFVLLGARQYRFLMSDVAAYIESKRVDPSLDNPRNRRGR